MTKKQMISFKVDASLIHRINHLISGYQFVNRSDVLRQAILIGIKCLEKDQTMEDIIDEQLQEPLNEDDRKCVIESDPVEVFYLSGRRAEYDTTQNNPSSTPSDTTHYISSPED